MVMARLIFVHIFFFSCALYLLQTMVAINALFNNQTDKAALLALKLQITNDSSDALHSWNETTYFCNWEGVFCSKKQKGRVMSINISSRGLVGHISSSIENLTFLHHLNLSHNQFFSTIPPSLFRMPRLHLLDLSINFLHGEIPYNLTSSLTILNLEGNSFSGSIPSSLGHLLKLSFLSLGNNSLTGKIPPSLGNLSSLQILDLFANQLEGSMPKEIGNHQSLQFLQVSENKLSGELPLSIFNLSLVYCFSVAVNNFEGKIPESLGRLRSLNHLNFSFNYLIGEVPNEGVFLNATSTYLQGNYELCGGVPDLNLLACRDISSSKNRRNPLLEILLPSMAIFSLIIFFILCFIYKRKNLNKDLSKPKIIEDIYPNISYIELVRATNNFSPANLLGVRQHGSVYKGSLYKYGYTIVAVKVFNLQRRGATTAFTVECKALRHIRHRNLVKILTCCVGIDSKGDDFMAIVFEFMPNGNLDAWLHFNDNRMEHLDLIKRLDIAINIADALCYLHHECQTQIIHCDVKPSNVLLDDDMVAHIGDFGLARILHKIVSNPLNDSDQSSLVIRGTIGYAAPEYGVGSEVSAMGDVYSYGILLLELFTGRRPVDENFKDGLNLHNFVEIAIPDRVMEVIDLNLQLQFWDKAKNDVQSRIAISKCLTSILQLSLSCSKESARERISMTNVAIELHSIRDQSFKAGLNVVRYEIELS